MTDHNQLPETPETDLKMAQQLEKEMMSVIHQIKKLNRRIEKLNDRLPDMPEKQRKSPARDCTEPQENKKDNSLSVLCRLPRAIKNFQVDLLVVQDENERESYGVTLLFHNYKMLLFSLVIALAFNSFFIPPANSPKNIQPQEIDRVENIDPGDASEPEEN